MLHWTSLLWLLRRRSPPAEQFRVEVGDWSGHSVRPELASYTIDLSADRGFFDRNLRNDKLTFLAKQLAPAYVRFGGTGGDRLAYFTDDECPGALQAKCWDASRTQGRKPKSRPRCLNRTHWESVVQFAEEAEAKLVMGVNGYASEESLVKFLREAAPHLSVLEVGNEMFTHKGKTPERCVEQQARLSEAVRAAFPELRFAGPDSGPPIHPEYLSRVSAPLFAYTLHDYPLDQGNFVNARRWRDDLDALGGSSTQLWVGEGGGKTSGGRRGLTDSFSSGHWYLDSLGAYAVHGVDVFCRQDLVGASYGLLRDGCNFGGLNKNDERCDARVNPKPNPDYWNALLWKKVLFDDDSSNSSFPLAARVHRRRGRRRLRGGVAFPTLHFLREEEPPALRAYAHCSANGQLSLVLINTDARKPAEVSVVVGSVQAATTESDRTESDRTEWHLTSHRVTSHKSFLNGARLKVRKGDGGNWTLPPLDGVKAHDPAGPVRVAAQSYSFVTFSPASPSCTSAIAAAAS